MATAEPAVEPYGELTPALDAVGRWNPWRKRDGPLSTSCSDDPVDKSRLSCSLGGGVSGAPS